MLPHVEHQVGGNQRTAAGVVEDYLTDNRQRAEHELIDLSGPGGRCFVAQYAVEVEIAALLRKPRGGIEARLRVYGTIVAHVEVMVLVRRDDRPDGSEPVESTTRFRIESHRRVHEKTAVGEADHGHSRAHLDAEK